MTKKTGVRKVYGRTHDPYRKHETLSDETDLRDEILELKRQLMVLKRENDQLLIKLRKYEDEAKRKDKQLEELMDPRKNADITKVISTKGAVILMNLKDQNNALIQIILNKDLHIRRLMAELKTTKLYASTKKNDTYRAEINSLKNLLMKLEQINNVQQQRPICTSENSVFESSTPPRQSSPRDLDELRQTISSLESHIKNSHDLLAKKNQEISVLEDKVNFFKKFFRHKTSTNELFDPDPNEIRDQKILTCYNFTRQQPLSQIKISNQNILDLFDKNMNQTDHSYQTLAGSTQWFSSINSIQKYSFQSRVTKKRTENSIKPSFIITNEKNVEKVTDLVPVTGKSVFHDLPLDEKKEGKIHSNIKKRFRTKGKWKKALDKYREHKKLESQMYKLPQVHIQEDYKQNENSNGTEFPEREQEAELEDELKSKANVSQNCQIKSDVFLEKLDSSVSFAQPFKNNQKLKNSHDGTVTIITEKLCNETCQSSQKHLADKDYQKPELFLQDETHTKKRIILKNSSNNQNYCFKTLPNVTDPNEIESKKKSLTEIQLQSFSSSFDSVYSYPLKHGVQQVQIEAQINSLSYQSDSDQLENNQIFEDNKKSDGNSTSDFDFNDDDDVIIRQK